VPDSPRCRLRDAGAKHARQSHSTAAHVHQQRVVGSWGPAVNEITVDEAQESVSYQQVKMPVKRAPAAGIAFLSDITLAQGCACIIFSLTSPPLLRIVAAQHLPASFITVAAVPPHHFILQAQTSRTKTHFHRTRLEKQSGREPPPPLLPPPQRCAAFCDRCRRRHWRQLAQS
jgi:hypothetical protein